MNSFHVCYWCNNYRRQNHLTCSKCRHREAHATFDKAICEQHFRWFGLWKIVFLWRRSRALCRITTLSCEGRADRVHLRTQIYKRRLFKWIMIRRPLDCLPIWVTPESLRTQSQTRRSRARTS